MRKGKSGVEYLAQHSGWRTKSRGKIGDCFWNLLSGKVEYTSQWSAWVRLCEKHGADPEQVLGLLNRVHAVISTRSHEGKQGYPMSEYTDPMYLDKETP